MAGGFWTSETLKSRMPEIVDPFNEAAIVSCGYELSVGSEAFVTDDKAEKLFLKDGETIIIPPGQVALLITKETITAPLDAIGFLSFKFGAKLRGLINVSGFHVDPGFRGKLIFSMYNAGVQNIHLSVGSRLFMMWFCSLEGPTTDNYKGGHKGQVHLSDDAVTNLAARMPSPFTLEKDVQALRHELDKVHRYLAILITLAGAALIATLRSCGQSAQPPAPPLASPPAAAIQNSSPPVIPPSPNPTTNSAPAHVAAP